MLYIPNNSRDPFFNLALEEYLLIERPDLEEIFLLWQDDPTVVVGRNQNSHAEINQAFIEERQINLARRLSGGGAVYHDQGNLNFTFISKDLSQPGLDFARFTRPVIRTLEKIGVKAENSGRNDITIQGKKISGNAQYRYKDRLLHHGTLLFAANLDDMTEVLQVDNQKLSNRGINSVRSRVTNINEYITEPMSMHDFKALLQENILKDAGDFSIYELSTADRQEIEKLRREKYMTWAWNYGESPGFNVRNSARFEWGRLECCLDVKKGIIANCVFYGDFFALRDIEELAILLINNPYNRIALAEIIAHIKLANFIYGLTAEQLLAVIFS